MKYAPYLRAIAVTGEFPVNEIDYYIVFAFQKYIVSDLFFVKDNKIYSKHGAYGLIIHMIVEILTNRTWNKYECYDYVLPSWTVLAAIRPYEFFEYIISKDIIEFEK